MISDLDYEWIKFPVSKKIIAKLKDKKIFELMCFVMKMDWLIMVMYQIKNLEIVWICCWCQVKISLVMCISKILTDSCLIKQKKYIKIFLQMLFRVF